MRRGGEDNWAEHHEPQGWCDGFHCPHTVRYPVFCPRYQGSLRSNTHRPHTHPTPHPIPPLGWRSVYVFPPLRREGQRVRDRHTTRPVTADLASPPRSLLAFPSALQRTARCSPKKKLNVYVFQKTIEGFYPPSQPLTPPPLSAVPTIPWLGILTGLFYYLGSFLIVVCASVSALRATSRGFAQDPPWFVTHPTCSTNPLSNQSMG